MHSLTKKQPKLFFNEPKPDQYFKFNKIMSKISGFLLITDKTGIFYRATNLAYFLFLDFVLYHISILTLVDFYSELDTDLYQTALNLITVSANVCVFGIQLMVQFRHKQLKELFDFAENKLRFRSARGLSVVTLAPRLHSARRLSAIITFGTLAGVLQWVIDPLIQTIQKGHRILPFDMKYPFDVYRSPWYQITFTLQAANQFIIVLCTTTLISNYMTLSTIVRAQYLILCSSARNVCATGALRAGVRYDVLARTCSMDVRKNHELHEQEGVEIGDCRFDCKEGREIAVLHTDIEESSANDMYASHFTSEPNPDFSLYETFIMEAINDCGHHHLAIREFCAAMENYTAGPIMLHILTLVVEIAVSLFAASLKFELKIGAYLSLSAVYLFFYCLYGSTLFQESELISDAAWEATWTGGGRRVDRTLAVLMTQYARPMQLKSSVFFNLSLDSYIKSTKLSFSFYTLLQAIKDK